MKLKFRTNLGSRDAAKLGLDYTKCQVGESVDVSDDVAEFLVKRGIAEAEPASKAKAPAPKISSAKDAEIK